MKLSIFSKKNSRSDAERVNCARGFTMAELMVTVTIMMIMTGVVFFNYGKFNESMLMNQVAYDLSLTIRQAQVYGVAAKEGVGDVQGNNINLENIGSRNFENSYGVHFEKDKDHFFLFIDVPSVQDADGNWIGNGKYNIADGDAELQKYFFPRDIKIWKLCFDVINPDNPNNCIDGDDASGQKAQILDVTFTRPDPEAKIKLSVPDEPADSVDIYLQNVGGDITKKVVVYSTGQISVQSVQ